MPVEYVRCTQPLVVRHPEGGWLDVLNPSKAYRTDDPLVLAYPWAFERDADRDPNAGPVEQATRGPGERRPYTRRG